jgi:hypothetical protein
MSADPRQDTETRMRELLREAALPEPDRVEYEESSIFLYWDEEKLVVEVAEIPVDAPATAREAGG